MNNAICMLNLRFEHENKNPVLYSFSLQYDRLGLYVHIKQAFILS